MSEQTHSAAYSRPCRYCHTPVLMAVLVTGRWRAFDPEPVDVEPGLYRFRRGAGMVEVSDVPGYRLHVCEEQSRLSGALADVDLLRF